VRGPVFFCFDGSDDAGAAVRTAGDVIQSGSAVVVTAWQPLRHTAIWSPGLLAEVGGGVEELDRIAANQALECATEGVAIAEEAGFTAEPLVCEAQGAVWAALMHRAEDHSASVIVVGRRGRSPLAATMLGSVSLGLLNHSNVPVFVAPPRGIGE
jgi:nucleotide-binding universal stress UspA family protein